MEKEKLVVHGGAGGGGLPPSVARCSSLSATSSSFVPAKCDALTSSSAGLFSHDISGMTDYPSKKLGHRRAHSEILCLPDDISFGSDLGVVGSAGGPSLSDETEDDVLSMYLDMDKFMFSGSTLGSETSLTASAPIAPSTQQDNIGETSGQKPRVRHQHSQSMDDSAIKSEILASGAEGMSLVEPKKAISAEKLADLALIDPKRAKRIWANRQSAARSKERKMRYIGELERKVQTLQTEATTLSTQLTMLQRDNTGLNAENSELKLRVQTMEQQVRLQDALNNTLRDEVQRLKVATGQPLAANGGQMINYGQSSFGLGQQNYHLNHSMQSILAAQQLKQLQIHSQHQQNIQAQQHQLQQSLQSTELKIRGSIAPQMQRDSASDNCTRQE